VDDRGHDNKRRDGGMDWDGRRRRWCRGERPCQLVKARTAVKGIENARWGLYAILKKPDDLAGLSSLLQQIAELQVSFGDLAKEELAGPPPRRRILRKRRPSAVGTEAMS
jgi:hypothetical protein